MTPAARRCSGEPTWRSYCERLPRAELRHRSGNEGPQSSAGSTHPLLRPLRLKPDRCQMPIETTRSSGLLSYRTRPRPKSGTSPCVFKATTHAISTLRMRYLSRSLFLVLAIGFLPLDSLAQPAWRAELSNDIVDIRDGVMELSDDFLFTIDPPEGESVRLRIHVLATAPVTGPVGRDKLISVATATV